MKIRNRFYISHPKITQPGEQDQPNLFNADYERSGNSRGRWSKATLKDVLKHAEQHLEQNPTIEHVAITQIIRVVRRKKAPLVVEVVK